MRPWLYRIATNVCLDEIHDRKARPMPTNVVPSTSDPLAPPAQKSPEVTWLEPMPDTWLGGVEREPDAAYEVKESVALAFVAALQCLSARERAVLLLRDVVGMPADEAATALDMSVPAANSALFRARSAVRERANGGTDSVRVDATSEVDEALLTRYIHAWQAQDLTSFLELLHEDVTVSMPPSPTWFRGKETAAAFIAARPFAGLKQSAIALRRTGANGQPALAYYVNGVFHAIQVLRFREGRVIEIHHFLDAKPLAGFDLPATLSTGA
jgi:RNA polymerase sigma-70 factor (ECF subfamily)